VDRQRCPLGGGPGRLHRPGQLTGQVDGHHRGRSVGRRRDVRVGERRRRRLGRGDARTALEGGDRRRAQVRTDERRTVDEHLERYDLHAPAFGGAGGQCRGRVRHDGDVGRQPR